METGGQGSVRYENLEIEISRCCCGEREVRILDSPVDRPREKMVLTSEGLEDLQAKIDSYHGLVLAGSPAHRAEAGRLAQEIGARLFELATPGKVGATFRDSLLELDRQRREANVGRRFRFSFGQGASYDPALANLPWELICDPAGGGRFLVAEPQTQVARYLEVTRAIQPLRVEPPLRILAVLSSPSDQPKIDLSTQEVLLRRAIEAHPGRLEHHFLRPPMLSTLRETLTQHQDQGRPFHVLHFLGHGELKEERQGALYFEAEGRSQHVVRASVLGSMLSDFRDLRLVVLATCEGARLPRCNGQNPFTGSASALLARNIPAVVAMQFSVSEQAAAAFTSAFYSKLATSCAVDEAVAEGRLRILSENTEGCEWATPVLFLRSLDGTVLDLDPGPKQAVHPKQPLPSMVSEGIRPDEELARAGPGRSGRQNPSRNRGAVEILLKGPGSVRLTLGIGLLFVTLGVVGFRFVEEWLSATTQCSGLEVIGLELDLIPRASRHLGSQIVLEPDQLMGARVTGRAIFENSLPSSSCACSWTVRDWNASTFRDLTNRNDVCGFDLDLRKQRFPLDLKLTIEGQKTLLFTIIKGKAE